MKDQHCAAHFEVEKKTITKLAKRDINDLKQVFRYKYCLCYFEFEMQKCLLLHKTVKTFSAIFCKRILLNYLFIQKWSTLVEVYGKI